MARIERRIPAIERFGYYSIYADTIEEINDIEAQIDKIMEAKRKAKEEKPTEKNQLKQIELDNKNWKPFE